MSKTITLIELFNKMASFDEQENLPEEIKYRDCVFTKIYGEGISPDYINKNSDTILEYVATEADDLNEIVEIIEEQEEINIQELEEIKEMEVFLSVDTRQTLEENLKKIDKHEVNFFFKINEIIRKQNKIVQYLEQLDKNIKEK